MERFDFFKLSRERQERFIASTKGAAPPAPILARRGGTSSARIHALIALIAALLFAGLLVQGFGSLSSPLAVHKPALLGAYVVLVFLLPFGVLRALAFARETKMLPYKAGIYAFPMTLIDARQKHLRVYPMTDLVKAEPGPGGFVLTVKGAGAISFPLGSGESADQLSQQIEIAKANVAHAVASQDEGELVTLDPLYEGKRWSSPIGPKEALIETPPGYKRLTPLIALAVAITLGPLMWFSRNASSEDSMLLKATALNTPAAYRQYLAVGSRHSDDVSRVMLPRAELKDAQALGTVEGMQAFIASHPNSAIDGEAQNALHDAYARELETAKKVGTVTALQAFAQKYPQHGMSADLAKATHALYDAVFAKFKTRAASADPGLLSFVQRLLAFLEAHGPTMRVAIARELGPGVERADKFIGASSLNRGRGNKQVSHWFDAPPPTSADVIAKSIATTFDDVFPTDVLTFAAAPNADDNAIAALKEPSIFIKLRIDWPGVVYGSTTMKRAFAGISMSGDATATIPGDPKTFHISVVVGAARGLLLEYETPTHPLMKSNITVNPDAPEAGVYGLQELRGIDLATSVVERAFFKMEKH